MNVWPNINEDQLSFYDAEHLTAKKERIRPIHESRHKELSVKGNWSLELVTNCKVDITYEFDNEYYERITLVGSKSESIPKDLEETKKCQIFDMSRDLKKRQRLKLFKKSCIVIPYGLSGSFMRTYGKQITKYNLATVIWDYNNQRTIPRLGKIRLKGDKVLRLRLGYSYEPYSVILSRLESLVTTLDQNNTPVRKVVLKRDHCSPITVLR